MRGALAFLLSATPLLAWVQAPPQPPDCLTESVQQRDKMQFFVCLNLRRERSEDLLRKINSECGPGSRKYQAAFERYTSVRNQADALLDMVVADLRFGVHVKSSRYHQLMKDLGDAIQGFEALDQEMACDGSKTKFIALLIPIFSSVLTSKLQETITTWLSGNKAEKEARAQLLTTQRWKLPGELSVPYPVVAAAPAAPAAPAP